MKMRIKLVFRSENIIETITLDREGTREDYIVVDQHGRHFRFIEFKNGVNVYHECNVVKVTTQTRSND